MTNLVGIVAIALLKFALQFTGNIKNISHEFRRLVVRTNMGSGGMSIYLTE